MKKKSILFVMPELPYPPRKNGLTLRIYSLIKHLCGSVDIDLAVINGCSLAQLDVGDLHEFTRKIIHVKQSDRRSSIFSKVAARLRQLSFVGIPYDLYTYDAAYVAGQMKSVLDSNYDAVVWISLLQSHYLYKCLPLLKRHYLIIDAIDCLSLHWARRFSGSSWLNKLRIKKMQRWESFLVDSAKACLYISPIDRDYIAPCVHKASLFVSPNGVMVEDYCFEKAVLESPSIGFLGNMSYMPNIEAAHILFRVFKRLKSRIPDLHLYIIGRDPAPAVLKYVEFPGVSVTGTVENIWPLVNSVDIFMLPMTMGAGQQNKLLEIMFAGKPIVATSVANGGVGAVDGESLLIADTEEEMYAKAMHLLEDSEFRSKVAVGGKKFVDEMYSWESVVGRFHDVLKLANI